MFFASYAEVESYGDMLQRRITHQEVTMVKCERPQVIFMHIPKNAGTTIREELMRRQIPFVYEMHKRSWRVTKDQHPQLWEDKECIKFTIIRNPVARFVSNYHFARKNRSEFHSAYGDRPLHPDYFVLRSSTLEECARLLERDAQNMADENVLLLDTHFGANRIQDLNIPAHNRYALHIVTRGKYALFACLRLLHRKIQKNSRLLHAHKELARTLLVVNAILQILVYCVDAFVMYLMVLSKLLTRPDERVEVRIPGFQ